jgi:hypothetical protein
MHERTAFRLAMLENGYWPLLNDCKRSIEKGWPKKRPDEAEVRSWDRSALTSTGLKLDGDLAVIDADVADQELIDALAGALRTGLKLTALVLQATGGGWCSSIRDGMGHR